MDPPIKPKKHVIEKSTVLSYDVLSILSSPSPSDAEDENYQPKESIELEVYTPAVKPKENVQKSWLTDSTLEEEDLPRNASIFSWGSQLFDIDLPSIISEEIAQPSNLILVSSTDPEGSVRLASEHDILSKNLRSTTPIRKVSFEKVTFQEGTQVPEFPTEQQDRGQQMSLQTELDDKSIQALKKLKKDVESLIPGTQSFLDYPRDKQFENRRIIFHPGHSSIPRNNLPKFIQKFYPKTDLKPTLSYDTMQPTILEDLFTQDQLNQMKIGDNFVKPNPRKSEEIIEIKPYKFPLCIGIQNPTDTPETRSSIDFEYSCSSNLSYTVLIEANLDQILEKTSSPSGDFKCPARVTDSNKYWVDCVKDPDIEKNAEVDSNPVSKICKRCIKAIQSLTGLTPPRSSKPENQGKSHQDEACSAYKNVTLLDKSEQTDVEIQSISDQSDSGVDETVKNEVFRVEVISKSRILSSCEQLKPIEKCLEKVYAEKLSQLVAIADLNKISSLMLQKTNLKPQEMMKAADPVPADSYKVKSEIDSKTETDPKKIVSQLQTTFVSMAKSIKDKLKSRSNAAKSLSKVGTSQEMKSSTKPERIIDNVRKNLKHKLFFGKTKLKVLEKSSFKASSKPIIITSIRAVAAESFSQINLIPELKSITQSAPDLISVTPPESFESFRETRSENEILQTFSDKKMEFIDRICQKLSPIFTRRHVDESLEFIASNTSMQTKQKVYEVLSYRVELDQDTSFESAKDFNDNADAQTSTIVFPKGEEKSTFQQTGASLDTVKPSSPQTFSTRTTKMQTHRNEDQADVQISPMSLPTAAEIATRSTKVQMGKSVLENVPKGGIKTEVQVQTSRTSSVNDEVLATRSIKSQVGTSIDMGVPRRRVKDNVDDVQTSATELEKYLQFSISTRSSGQQTDKSVDLGLRKVDLGKVITDADTSITEIDTGSRRRSGEIMKVQFKEDTGPKITFDDTPQILNEVKIEVDNVIIAAKASIESSRPINGFESKKDNITSAQEDELCNSEKKSSETVLKTILKDPKTSQEESPSEETQEKGVVLLEAKEYEGKDSALDVIKKEVKIVLPEEHQNREENLGQDIVATRDSQVAPEHLSMKVTVTETGKEFPKDQPTKESTIIKQQCSLKQAVEFNKDKSVVQDSLSIKATITQTGKSLEFPKECALKKDVKDTSQPLSIITQTGKSLEFPKELINQTLDPEPLSTLTQTGKSLLFPKEEINKICEEPSPYKLSELNPADITQLSITTQTGNSLDIPKEQITQLSSSTIHITTGKGPNAPGINLTEITKITIMTKNDKIDIVGEQILEVLQNNLFQKKISSLENSVKNEVDKVQQFTNIPKTDLDVIPEIGESTSGYERVEKIGESIEIGNINLEYISHLNPMVHSVGPKKGCCSANKLKKCNPVIPPKVEVLPCVPRPPSVPLSEYTKYLLQKEEEAAKRLELEEKEKRLKDVLMHYPSLNPNFNLKDNCEKN